MKTLAFLTGGEMLAISWRSSRRQIITWVVLGMIAVFAATAASINSFYGTAAELRSYAKAVSTDSSLDAISGRPYGLDNIGGPIAYECGFIAAITRVTRGNFRLRERLFPQIERILKINELDTITNDVIEAAQSTLVIGIT